MDLDTLIWKPFLARWTALSLWNSGYGVDESCRNKKKPTGLDALGFNISIDNSWLKQQGFSSHQGLASIVGHNTGMVLDVTIENSYYQPGWTVYMILLYIVLGDIYRFLNINLVYFFQ